LVALLNSTDSDEKTKQVAIQALRNLALERTNKDRIATEPQSISGLVDVLIMDKYKALQEPAIKTLSSLSLSKTCITLLSKLDNTIPSIIHCIKTGTPETKEHAAKVLNNVTVNPDSVPTGSVGSLIGLMVDLLESGNESSKTYVCGTLRQLAILPTNKQLVARYPNCLSLLLQIIANGTDSAKENAVGVIGNCSIQEKNRSFIAATDGAIETLSGVLLNGSDVAKEHAMRTFKSISTVSEARPKIAHPLSRLDAIVMTLTAGPGHSKEFAAATLANLSLDQKIAAELSQTKNCMEALSNLASSGSADANQALNQITTAITTPQGVQRRPSSSSLKKASKDDKPAQAVTGPPPGFEHAGPQHVRAFQFTAPEAMAVRQNSAYF